MRRRGERGVVYIEPEEADQSIDALKKEMVDRRNWTHILLIDPYVHTCSICFRKKNTTNIHDQLIMIYKSDFNFWIIYTTSIPSMVHTEY